MKKKINSYMGFAKKSGNLISGGNTCTITGSKGRLKLLIIAEDASENSREKMVRLAEKTDTAYRIYGRADDLSHAIGTSGRSVFGVTDRNFADTIMNAIDEVQEKEKEVFYDNESK